MRPDGGFHSGWRDYQKRLRQAERKRYLLKRVPLLCVYSGGSFLALILLFCLASWVSGRIFQDGPVASPAKRETPPQRGKITRQGLPVLLKEARLQGAGLPDRFACDTAGGQLSVFTSIDTALQEYVSNLLERSKTIEAAVVVLNPYDGRILAMASYRAGESASRENLCLKASFPAASLFKIVSAAAALETAGFSPDHAVYFLGRRHTLYKSQLKETTGRYATETSFRKAFARSINSVFGKLGIYDLGRKVLTEYSDRFLFNQMIPFDLPVAMSTINVPDDNFGLAEVASGFNKKTLISPLHAALLASAVANDGTMMMPWAVAKITDPTGAVLYEGKPAQLTSPISPKTAKDLKLLMRDTVRYGTCRRAFGRLRRKRTFQQIELGAKTGTINDKMDQFKFDWLTAYALPLKNRKAAICIAVLAVHGEKLGIRANELARYIIDYRMKS